CLTQGPSPVQTGLSEVLDPLRAAAIHGKVMTAAGDPLAGVSVTLKKTAWPAGMGSAPQLNSAGYGSTLTRVDGGFDMGVNAGGALILEYSRPGYLTAQREIQPEAGRFVNAPDVVLKARDAAVSTVEIGAGAADWQTARGSLVSDGRGVRQVALFF